MPEYYTVSEFATLSGKDPGNIRRMLINGTIKGEKLGNQWIIPKDTPIPNDKRIKSGAYRNWRKRSAIRQSNPGLMQALNNMSKDISKIYGNKLDRIVLYGSYARGEETPESDVDIALILKEDSDAMHDAMTDIVVNYELESELTLSVISIEEHNYRKWERVLPFYKNIAKEGIVLWTEQ